MGRRSLVQTIPEDAAQYKNIASDIQEIQELFQGEYMINAMDRIYAVYCKVTLTHQPIWLDEFRLRFDKPYDFHLTLKQAATIKLEQLGEIKQRLGAVLGSTSILDHKICLTFNKLVLDKHDDYDNKGYIYLFCKETNETLDKLQKDIRTELKDFSRYLNPHSIEHESSFEPHITIARELNEAQFKLATDLLEEDYVCNGEVNEIVISCVSEINPTKASDPTNLTIFKF